MMRLATNRVPDTAISTQPRTRTATPKTEPQTERSTHRPGPERPHLKQSPRQRDQHTGQDQNGHT
jgi:hypothetical protein